MYRKIFSRPHLSGAAALAALMTLALPGRADEAPLGVLATVGMIGDLAQTVAGSCAEVTTLLGSGTDPHAHSATPRDVAAIAAAELVFYVDRALEERLADVLDRMRDRVPTVGLLATAFDAADLLEDPAEPGLTDPHVWMDAARWSAIVPVIADAIAAQRPLCAPALAAAAEDLTAQLAALHDWVGAAIASIPEGQRLLITAHDAFGYFADAYGMEASEAIEGISTAAEASIGDILEVADFIVGNAVPAVFVETTVNPRTIEALVAEVRSRGHDVVIGGELFSDAMGDAGTAESTYIGMMRANTVTITEALGGTLPDWPEALGPWAVAWGVAP
ncbi:MAG: zinc ABC transporter substrate-binding protein [Rubellimicrobium sp.]|nr:zinc ABC transporter substrate-binding protein [Rubellimicrobium sp.]